MILFMVQVQNLCLDSYRLDLGKTLVTLVTVRGRDYDKCPSAGRLEGWLSG